MSYVLEYRGYQATVDYEDGKIVIHVQHVRDLLVAECEQVDQVKPEFHALIDGYIADCEDIGKEPEKPFSGTFNVRISPELHKKCARFAVIEGISLNELVSRALDAIVTKAETAIKTVQNDWKATPVVTSSAASGAVVVRFTAGRGKSAEFEGIAAAWSETLPKERRH